MYWTPRAKDGSLGAPRVALHEDGTELMAGEYWDFDAKVWTETDASGDADAHGMSVGPVDWDDDGDIDLLIGCTDGRIFLRRNVGGSGGPRFTVQNEKVKYGRRSLYVRSGDATPVAADWNGDGLFDIVSGSKMGGVIVWLNVGERGKPAFAPPRQLLDEVEGDPSSNAPGLRTQVHVTDYDGDGDADLVVGDYRRIDNKPHGLVWLVRREKAESVAGQK
ncbi:MAG: VCBS repeat-containing protein [Planctomycetota bacterium]